MTGINAWIGLSRPHAPIEMTEHNDTIRILCLGDIFGRPGRRMVKEHLPDLIRQHDVSFVVANGENAAGGKGLNRKCADELLDAGVHVLTNGNHLMDNKEIIPMLQEDSRIIRPWNMKDSTPGKGYAVIENNGVHFGVMNFMGEILMPHDRTPFEDLEANIQEVKDQCDIVIVDMHAEATSEMRVMGHVLAGKVSLVFGTHTHVPTADHEILEGGTGYITDIGMTGPYDSVIGIKKEYGIARIRGTQKKRFEVAKGDARLYAILCEVNPTTGQCTSIKPLVVKQ